MNFTGKISFFTNKFSPKKTPARKASASLVSKDLSPRRHQRELGPDVGPIKIKLGDQEATFEAGAWIPASETGRSAGVCKENEQLKAEIKQLEEENNLLKIKFDLLLDMITETTIEAEMQKNELERLRNKLSRGKRTAI